jgi:hypothetical protein
MLENGVLKLMRDLAVGDQVLVSIYSLDKNLKLISNQEGKGEVPYFRVRVSRFFPFVTSTSIM